MLIKNQGRLSFLVQNTDQPKVHPPFSNLANAIPKNSPVYNNRQHTENPIDYPCLNLP
jgi:hypothetical protein